MPAVITGLVCVQCRIQMKQQSHPCGEVCADVAILDVHFLH